MQRPFSKLALLLSLRPFGRARCAFAFAFISICLCVTSFHYVGLLLMRCAFALNASSCALAHLCFRSNFFPAHPRLLVEVVDDSSATGGARIVFGLSSVLRGLHRLCIWRLRLRQRARSLLARRVQRHFALAVSFDHVRLSAVDHATCALCSRRSPNAICGSIGVITSRNGPKAVWLHRTSDGGLSPLNSCDVPLGRSCALLR